MKSDAFHLSFFKIICHFDCSSVNNINIRTEFGVDFQFLYFPVKFCLVVKNSSAFFTVFLQQVGLTKSN